MNPLYNCSLIGRVSKPSIRVSNMGTEYSGVELKIFGQKDIVNVACHRCDCGRVPLPRRIRSSALLKAIAAVAAAIVFVATIVGEA